ncbi:unnamed protein product, partial [Durusdinium trenchii]
MAETPGSSGASDSHEFRRRACQFCKVFGKLQDLVYGPGSDDTLRERALGPLSSCYIGILEASHQLRYPELSTPGSAGAGTRQLLHHPRRGGATFWFGKRGNFDKLLIAGWQDMSAPRQVQMDSIDETKVVVHSACCCCYDGCIPEFNNIGCAAQETLLCLEADVCCKTNTPCLCCGCCAIRQVQMDSIDETKVVVHSACCCCYDGCIPEFNNIGCAAQETLLCLEADVCCKTNTPCLCCGCCAI